MQEARVPGKKEMHCANASSAVQEGMQLREYKKRNARKKEAKLRVSLESQRGTCFALRASCFLLCAI